MSIIIKASGWRDSTACRHSRSISRSNPRRLAKPLNPSRLASSSRCWFAILNSSSRSASLVAISSSAAASGANSVTHDSCVARTCRSPRPKRVAVRTSERIGPHDQLFAAEPRQQKNEQAEQDELQIGDVDPTIDGAMHGVLVETDGEPRLRAGHPDIGEYALHAV